jgi:hypothetical protein
VTWITRHIGWIRVAVIVDAFWVLIFAAYLLTPHQNDDGRLSS